MEGYDVAQICLNGHVSNSYCISQPKINIKFCEKCGSATITKCPACDFPIRGRSLDRYPPHYDVPNFCINCGQPFPWTRTKLQAAHDLAQELDNISESDRAALQNSLDDLVKDTPSTPLAVDRYKKIMVKVGQATAGIFREILIDILSEAAKKALFPS